MIKTKSKQIISVPCKNKRTNQVEEFEILAYDFSDAVKQLESLLSLDYIIGYHAM